MKTLLLIDSNAVMYRAYHAIPRLTNKQGILVNAVYGFASILISTLNKLHPDYAISAFDLPSPTFRHKMFAEYKANRKKGPSDLYEQIPFITAVLKAFNIPVIAKKGYEADDIIGSIAKQIQKLKNREIEIKILTGDLDTLQLVNERTSVYTPKHGLQQPVVYNIDAIQKRYGIKPNQIIDFKALKGDQSDNIPGVAGIGEKTAIELLQKHKTLKNIYNNLDAIKQSIRIKLENDEKNAWFSQKLATINCNLKIPIDIDKCSVKNYNINNIINLFEKLGFNSLINRIKKQ